MTTYFLPGSESIPLDIEDVAALLNDGSLQGSDLLRRASEQVFLRIDQLPEFIAVNVSERDKKKTKGWGYVIGSVVVGLLLATVLGLIAVRWLFPKANGCPWGTELVGLAPPNGTSQWCQKQDSKGNLVKHGRYREWRYNGQISLECAFDNNYLVECTLWWEGGQLQGRHRFASGVIAQMDFFDQDGRKVATWRTTPEFRAHTQAEQGQPWGGLGTMDSSKDVDAVYFDSTGDEVFRDDPRLGYVVILSRGRKVCSCRNVEGTIECFPDKKRTAEFKNATEWADYARRVIEGSLQ